ncbi:lipid asymmetry maintenance protein MlaB [Cellulosimicrobium sp. CUA-896]|uniref:STAS domain-containing protein n=1 Tax=Cellulosimicrobium sp. CUA-896 TaxID=1517881 RepID=UPI00095F4833|nr:STAS domain-containing protein [Cellulosimicrobium sp. CUA-896]OLT46148.1 hypothetical protein BJF88_04870 [Cellulosimicrobium sp. CUA-896]
MPSVPSRPPGTGTTPTASVEGDVWRLAGDLDAAALQLLGDELARAAAARAHGELVVDVSAVTFCDAAGLRLLCRTALAASGPVALVGVPERLRDLVALCGATFPFVLDESAGEVTAGGGSG